MKNILITGGAGYIGSVLVNNLLKDKFKVTCVDCLNFGIKSLTTPLQDNCFKFLNCNINNLNEINSILKLTKFDAIIHLAAIVGDPACKLYSNLAIQTNWASSKWLIDKCIEFKIPRFIFASTCSNYGKMKDSDSFVDETSALAPISLYAELKVKFEKYILEKKYLHNEFCPTILRFPTVYGLSPRMRFDLTVNEFARDLYFNKKLEVYDPDTWRPYCHTRDFARIIELVLKAEKNKVDFEIFNAGSDSNNFTKREIVKEICKIIDRNNILYSEKGRDPRNYRVNFKKIDQVLEFRPLINLKEGIEEIINCLNEKIFHSDGSYGNYIIKN